MTGVYRRVSPLHHHVAVILARWDGGILFNHGRCRAAVPAAQPEGGREEKEGGAGKPEGWREVQRSLRDGGRCREA